jgi:hypothetical protein
MQSRSALVHAICAADQQVSAGFGHDDDDHSVSCEVWSSVLWLQVRVEESKSKQLLPWEVVGEKGNKKKLNEVATDKEW